MNNPEKEPEIIILGAKPEDALGIMQVQYKTWLATYPDKEIGVTEEDVEDSYKDSFSEERIKTLQERIANLAEGELRLVAKEGEQIVGQCRFLVHPEANELKTIYVLPEYQGKGIGKKLWQAILPHLDASKDTLVNVASYNAGAIAFYEKLGFVDTGKRFKEERFRMKSGAIIPEMEMILKAKQ